MTAFLPITAEEMRARGWDRPDFVFVSADAYVDHPSFGLALLSRMLESQGYKVCVLAQPRWQDPHDFMTFGRPRLGFLVAAGNIDSMVAHYTAAKRKRSDDAYSPGGKAGRRPDRAVVVYARLIRQAYPDTPVIIGGLEASLRRFAHYDYWEDTVRPSILVDAGADLLVYGMGERQLTEIARRLDTGESPSGMKDVSGTCYLCPTEETPYGGTECPSLQNVLGSKREYAISVRMQQEEQDAVRGRMVKQKQGRQMLVQNPPMPPLTQGEMDALYALPFARTYHPVYEADGGVPAIEEVQFSLTHNRGCFGACHFCSIAFHQGRQMTMRSQDSLLAEAKQLIAMPGFKGYIHDVGGPTANFRKPSCTMQLEKGLCKHKMCLSPKPCGNLTVDHSEYLSILRELRALPKVKKVFIRSGIRYDYLLADRDTAFFKELVEYHVSGQLKVAPEHCAPAVLNRMGKPHIEAYKRFQQQFFTLTRQAGKEQYLVPYLMSSHPGSTLKEAIELALFLKQERIRPEQVQDFYPTPGTISTCMFYTGLDPFSLEPVYVAKTPQEKEMQRALLQYYKPQNYAVIKKALLSAGRRDLIGSGKNCLIPAAVPLERRNRNSYPHKDGKGGKTYGQKKK